MPDLLGEETRGGEQLTVDIELHLVPCAVSDPDRRALAVPGKMIERMLGHVTLTADAVENLQAGASFGPLTGRDRKEIEETHGLVRTRRDPQGFERQTRIAHRRMFSTPTTSRLATPTRSSWIPNRK